jgi:hypothetical protein
VTVVVSEFNEGQKKYVTNFLHREQPYYDYYYYYDYYLLLLLLVTS